MLILLVMLILMLSLTQMLIQMLMLLLMRLLMLMILPMSNSADGHALMLMLMLKPLQMLLCAYLIFVIFSTQADFKPSKFYTQKRVKFRRQKLPRDKNYTLCKITHRV